ncbi:hypothetical protein C8J57DRAFT_1524974 [Mycena rebaudengoi]|nr:hypothetical protein C8J57DRAFT_1524974 [Mycena rebaudengoi]
MHLFSRSRRLTTLTPHVPFSHAPHAPSLYALGALPLTPHAPFFCMRLLRLLHHFYTPSTPYPHALCASFCMRLMRLMHLFIRPRRVTPMPHAPHAPHAPSLYALGALPPAPLAPLFTSASRAFFMSLRGLTTRASCASFHICLTRLFYTPSAPLHTPMRLFSHPPHAPFYTPSASYHPRLMRLFSCIFFIYALGVLPGTQACTFDIKPSTVPVHRFLPAHKPFLVVHFDGSFYSRPLVVHAARAYRSRRTQLHVYFILFYCQCFGRGLFRTSRRASGARTL